MRAFGLRVYLKKSIEKVHKTCTSMAEMWGSARRFSQKKK